MANEKRLIDANAMEQVFRNGIDRVLKCVASTRAKEVAKITLEWCVSKLSKALTVDAVEVVRCKNCRSWTRNIENHKCYGTCYRRGFSKGVPTHEDGYCDGGIKRGESGEH